MIPRAPLILGIVGLAPFLWGALTLGSSDLATWSVLTLGTRFSGPFLPLSYGQIILAFMSGILWGFASRTHGSRAAVGYTLSVLPVIWVFVMVGSGPASSAVYLIAGFIAVLGLDWSFWRQGLAPEWWMRLRILLTLVVVACLSLLVI